MNYKFFSCFKVTDKKNEKAPDYRLSMKVGEEYVEIGAGWLKDSEKGKFISFKMSEPYGDRPGFAITEVKKPEYPESTGEVAFD